jgi:hypothetical protein
MRRRKAIALCLQYSMAANGKSGVLTVGESNWK